MPTKIDGTNGVLQAYDFQVLTTGFSYTFADGTQTLIANPAGTLATGTVTMPASPVDGMVITIESTQQITALTIQGNTGQSLVGGAITMRANQPESFIYRLANTTWYPFAGAANTQIISGTSQASTSGTSIDFTGIPSWVRRVTVMFNGVSTSGTSNYLIQIGSGSVTSSGYTSTAGTNGGTGTTSTAGFLCTAVTSAADTQLGHAVITLTTSTTYVCSAILAQYSGTTRTNTSGGNVTLGGALDRVRITTVNGTDTFDAGSINILYE
jgi:hypothetical protein